MAAVDPSRALTSKNFLVPALPVLRRTAHLHRSKFHWTISTEILAHLLVLTFSSEMEVQALPLFASTQCALAQAVPKRSLLDT